MLWVNNYFIKNYKEWTKIILGPYIPQENATSIRLNLELNGGNRKDISHTDTSEIRFDDIEITESDLPIIKQPAELIINGQGYTFWAASPLQSVYVDDPAPAALSRDKKVKITGAKGEKEAFQRVVNPKEDWDRVTWEWSDFSGPDTMVKSMMKSLRVDYINLPERDTKLRKYLRGGHVPDPLPAEENFSTAKK